MRESTLWLFHLLAGAVLLTVLGVHYGVMHLSNLFGIDHAMVLSFGSVAGRSGQPFYLVVYLVLLPAALYHGFYGLRSLIFELSFIGPVLRRWISRILVLSGFGFFIFGAYAIITGFLG